MVEATSKQDCQRESYHVSVRLYPHDMWSLGVVEKKIWHAFVFLDKGGPLIIILSIGVYM